jgi:hypothetical protein
MLKNVKFMELLLIPRQGDRERLRDNIQLLSAFSLEDLIEEYNKSCEIGITGNQMQGIRLLAMHKVFLDKCGKSPISWTENMILAIGNPVVAVEGGWETSK